MSNLDIASELQIQAASDHDAAAKHHHAAAKCHDQKKLTDARNRSENAMDCCKTAQQQTETACAYSAK